MILGIATCFVSKAQKFDPSLVGASFIPPLQVGDYPLKIVASESQLFVDDYLIHSTSDITRIFHQPKKYEGNPILSTEHANHANGTILYDPDEKQYRMYYEGGHRVAFSSDGINWTMPNLGIITHKGSTDNNMIMDYSYRTDLSSFIYDPRDSDPRKRWKAAVYYYDKDENPEPTKEGLHAHYSSDGLHWKRGDLLIPGMARIPLEEGNPESWPLTGIDDVSTVIWDKRLGKFVAWLKVWELTDGRFYRSRAMSLSDDFVHWTQPWAIIFADKLDPPGLQLYGMTGWLYESMWLGTIRTYHSSTSHQPVDFQLVSSRDGIHWARAANRGAFIPNGPEGSYDHGYHTDFSNPPLRFGNELYFYYGSTAYGKDGVPSDIVTGICLAKLRVDGFSSLHAKSTTKTGYVITRPLDFDGKTLFVNADATNGSVRVEILSGTQDNDFEPITGFTLQESIPIKEDSIEQQVIWERQRDLTSLKGKRIRLKFYLDGLASLYSFTTR